MMFYYLGERTTYSKLYKNLSVNLGLADNYPPQAFSLVAPYFSKLNSLLTQPSRYFFTRATSPQFHKFLKPLTKPPPWSNSTEHLRNLRFCNNTKKSKQKISQRLFRALEQEIFITSSGLFAGFIACCSNLFLLFFWWRSGCLESILHSDWLIFFATFFFLPFASISSSHLTTTA